MWKTSPVHALGRVSVVAPLRLPLSSCGGDSNPLEPAMGARVEPPSDGRHRWLVGGALRFSGRQARKKPRGACTAGLGVCRLVRSLDADCRVS